MSLNADNYQTFPEKYSNLWQGSFLCHDYSCLSRLEGGFSPVNLLSTLMRSENKWKKSQNSHYYGHSNLHNIFATLLNLKWSNVASDGPEKSVISLSLGYRGADGEALWINSRSLSFTQKEESDSFPFSICSKFTDNLLHICLVSLGINLITDAASLLP